MESQTVGGMVINAVPSQSATCRLECLLDKPCSFILSPALVSSQRKRTKRGVGSHECKLTRCLPLDLGLLCVLSLSSRPATQSSPHSRAGRSLRCHSPTDILFTAVPAKGLKRRFGSCGLHSKPPPPPPQPGWGLQAPFPPGACWGRGAACGVGEP